jgi:predicted DNA-binding transcriptional regulator YafY
MMPKHYFNRLGHLNQLIMKKSTGSPIELAKKMNVSERTTYEYLEILKSLGAEIKYSRTRRSYYYSIDGTFNFQFQKNNSE